MVASDVAGVGAFFVIDEAINNRNNPIDVENFVIRGLEQKIFRADKDNDLENFENFEYLYRDLEKKEIIIKRLTLSAVYAMSFKFVTSNKDLLSSQSLKKNLPEYKGKIHFSKLSHLLTNYKYDTRDHTKIVEMLSKYKFKKSQVTKYQDNNNQGGKKTKKMRKKNKRNKTTLHKRF